MRGRRFRRAARRDVVVDARAGASELGRVALDERAHEFGSPPGVANRLCSDDLEPQRQRPDARNVAAGRELRAARPLVVRSAAFEPARQRIPLDVLPCDITRTSTTDGSEPPPRGEVVDDAREAEVRRVSRVDRVDGRRAEPARATPAGSSRGSSRSGGSARRARIPPTYVYRVAGSAESSTESTRPWATGERTKAACHMPSAVPSCE